MYKKTENTVVINGKKKCIYCKAKSRAQYVRHDKKYMTVKEYKDLLKKKDKNRMNKKKNRKMRGGATIEELHKEITIFLDKVESEKQASLIEELIKILNIENLSDILLEKDKLKGALCKLYLSQYLHDIKSIITLSKEKLVNDVSTVFTLEDSQKQTLERIINDNYLNFNANIKANITDVIETANE